MTPFAAGIGFYAALAEQQSAPGAGSEAGVWPGPGIGKERARAVIAAPGGSLSETVRLSVPVAGGAHALRSRHVCDPEISQHGRWQDVHLGAWRAAYGRTPFFIHLYPEIERIYAGYTHGRLSCFCDALHGLAMCWLGLPASAEALRRALRSEPERYHGVIEEYKHILTPDISIFDPLFRYGRNTLFLLFAIIGRERR